MDPQRELYMYVRRGTVKYHYSSPHDTTHYEVEHSFRAIGYTLRQGRNNANLIVHGLNQRLWKIEEEKRL